MLENFGNTQLKITVTLVETTTIDMSKPVETYSVADVQQLLEDLGLVHLKAIFVKNAVNGRDLLSFDKDTLIRELGTTELQARKILEEVGRRRQQHEQEAAGSGSPPPPVHVGVPQQQYVVQPGPVVVQGANGYQYQYFPRERYIGGITVLIAICFCFPCIFCCPVDERDPRPAVVVTQAPPVSSPPGSVQAQR